MRKLFKRQLEKATLPCGTVDLAALEDLVSSAYEDMTRDSERADRPVALAIETVEQRDWQIERQIVQSEPMDAIGQLTGGIAHDFNNILTVITGTIEILADAVADRPDALIITRMISQAAERGADLTRQLLAFSRKQPLRPQETDVNTLIHATTRLLAAAAGERIEIKCSLDARTWPALVDKSQLTTALLNLTVNARDAMPKGGTISIACENMTVDHGHEMCGDVAPGDYVRICVTDQGVGIPAAIRDKMFEPYFKGVGKGTGLGLSMVYGFVKQSGGQVRIESEEGRGTSIEIHLPRAGARTVAASEKIPMSGVARGGTGTILVARG